LAWLPCGVHVATHTRCSVYPKLYCYSELRYATGEESTDPSNWCRRDSKYEGNSRYNTCSEFYDNPAEFQCPAAFKFLTKIHNPKLYCYSAERASAGPRRRLLLCAARLAWCPPLHGLAAIISHLFYCPSWHGLFVVEMFHNPFVSCQAEVSICCGATI
jgi:hypothetical protein